ncbi:MAG: TetR family transcriptional regulator [Rhodomicrobium sp.]|nr:MAG: TetR family transcriptional regulator [Rhodomicrobium sp.]
MRPNKRDELVRKALKIFYREGFHTAGMDMLAAETGISKTTMFKHFRTKEDLILAVLRLRDEEFRGWLFRRIKEAGAPQAQLLAIFDALSEWFATEEFSSCLFIKASCEYPDSTHPIHSQASEHKRLLFREIERIASEAGAKDPAVLARGLLLLKDGATVMAHFDHEQDPAGDAKRAATLLLSEQIDGTIDRD